MSDFSVSKMVKIRKPHQCYTCMKKCDAGDSMAINSGIFEGDFYSNYWCVNCVRFSQEIAQYPDYSEGYEFGCFKEDYRYEEFLNPPIIIKNE